jgi:tRNA A-37 threonylcarbamoyl transferase component Bud32/tetratricopeptide (TPR) repeat protein
MDESGERQRDVTGNDNGPQEAPLKPTEETVVGLQIPGNSKDPRLQMRLGNIVIESVLGEGGFGVVYRGRDEKLGRIVAVKFLQNVLDEAQRTLFEREAKAIAALSKHPSVVQIYEWGEHSGHPYFVLEYVEGSASRLLIEHPEGVPVPVALRIALDAAEALGYAHDQGILHRDVKPGNILIEKENGRAKIVDFGLAAFRSFRDGEQSGTISGSPSYMSPEQASGGRIDGRSDVFSLGVTLYQLLSNRRPFEAESTAKIITLIQTGEKVPLSAYRPDLPKGIVDMVEKATAHEPADRFQSADEFASEIRRVLISLERSGAVNAADSPQRPARARKAPMIVAAAVFILCVAAAVLYAPRWNGKSGRFSRQALAAAVTKMEEGDFRAAEEAIRSYLDTHANESDALYALGFSQVCQGKLGEAEEVFRRVDDPALRGEGESTVAFERSREQARPQLEQARAQGASGYADVLLAHLDLVAGQYAQVVDRLAVLKPNELRFRWQYADALQLLGQAYYHLGEYEKARAVFAALQQSALPAQRTIIAAYSQSVAAKLDAAKREEAVAAARRVREQLDRGVQPPANADPWTSRPLTFFVLPSDATQSPMAVESGLTDVLHILLGDALDAGAPRNRPGAAGGAPRNHPGAAGSARMNLVDREVINEILAEQELSALVGSQAGQLALGKVLGARLIIACRFARLDGNDQLLFKVDDTETTERLPVSPMVLDRGTSASVLVQEAAKRILGALAEAYPIQGRLYREGSQAMVNVGLQVGLDEGTRFRICRDPELQPLPDAAAQVDGPPGPNSATLKLVGLNVAQLPERAEEGWYVRGVPKSP